MFKRTVVSLIFLLFLISSQVSVAQLEGLVLYLPFEAGSGDTAKDGSGNGNDGEIDGADWTPGKIGQGLEFDGSSFVEVPSSDSLESLVEEMTVAAWINPELSGSTWQGIVTKGQDGLEHFEMLLNVDGHVHTAQMFEGGRLFLDRPTVVVQGEWQHLAVTYKPGEWIFYYNGEAVDVNEEASTNLVPDGQPVVVGDERPMDRLFQGKIDEVAVFNRAITEEEVNLIMGGIEQIMTVEPLGKIAITWADIKQ